MGFCWSWKRGPPHEGWVGPTALLCVYGSCVMMRPNEPFLTDFLTGPYKNLTTQQVSRQVIPVWAYSSLFLLIPVFLVTDILRYKPIIVLQALTYILTFLLLLFGPGVASAQCALFIYSIAIAADVAYFSYIYSVVHPRYYQRVTSYARGAVLLGYAVGAMLGQLLLSFGDVSLYCLNVITLISLCVALLVSFLLPMPRRSLLFKEAHANGRPAVDTLSGSDGSGALSWMRRSRRAGREVVWALRRLLLDCKECYSSVAVLFFCVWSAMGKCGFYQVTEYVQILWASKQPHGNFTAYNGGVEAFATLSGAAASIAVGHVALDWSVWGELVLGGFSAVIAGTLYLMDLTNNIWVCYSCYALFKAVYMQLITICTFQIARNLSRERYALVFGVNSFLGMVLQSLLTAIVINTKSLQLTITSQFFIYASYFVAIALLFLIRGLYSVLHMKHRQPEDNTPADAPSDRSDLPKSHVCDQGKYIRIKKPDTVLNERLNPPACLTNDAATDVVYTWVYSTDVVYTWVYSTDVVYTWVYSTDVVYTWVYSTDVVYTWVYSTDVVYTWVYSTDVEKD